MTPVREALEEIIGLLDKMAALHPSRDLREVLPDPKGLADRARLLLSAAPGEPCAWADSQGLERPIDAEAMKHLRQNPTTGSYWSRFSIPLYTTPQPAAGPECMGRKQSLPEPGECNWPDCGCDPHATKVIESLVEQGWTAPREAPAPTEGVK